MNNQYGAAMKHKLPIGGFEWVDIVIESDDVGHHLEVDLSYPKELHDEHESLPLAPEATYFEDVSVYQTKVMLDNDIKPVKLRSNKLISHFHKRERYVVEYDTLNYYVSKGLVVDKIHRILKYKVKNLDGIVY